MNSEFNSILTFALSTKKGGTSPLHEKKREAKVVDYVYLFNTFTWSVPANCVPLTVPVIVRLIS